MSGVFVFITSSTKRYDVYSDKLQQSNEEPITLKLRNLSGTRWVAREESIRAVWSLYAILLEVLEVLTNSKYDTKTRVKAAGLRDKMKSFNFVVMLMFMKNVIGKTKCLTTEIRSINMNIIDTIDSFKATISTLDTFEMIMTASTIRCTVSIPMLNTTGTIANARELCRIDNNPETAAILSPVNRYRKEFVAVLDAQINALKANLKAVTNILQPVKTLLQPPYNGPVDNTALNKLCDMLSASKQPDTD